MEFLGDVIMCLLTICGIIFYIYVLAITAFHDGYKGRDMLSYIVSSFIFGGGGIVIASLMGREVQILYFFIFIYGFPYCWIKNYI